jgi:hypothetical protein
MCPDADDDTLLAKHGCNEPSDAMCAADSAARRIIERIMNATAEGLLGIAIKLSALPVDELRDEYDNREAMLNAVEELDRILGTQFRATHDRGFGEE